MIRTMNNDLSELIQYLDERFGKVDKQLEEMREEFSDLQTSVDNYAVKADKYFKK